MSKLEKIAGKFLPLVAIVGLFLVWTGLTLLPVWVVYCEQVRPLEKKVEALQKIVANDGVMLKDRKEQIESLRTAANTYLDENGAMRIGLISISTETSNGNDGCVDRLIEIRRIAMSSLKGTSNSENGP